MQQQIITTPDPRLREKALKVKEISEDIHEIIRDMVEISIEWEKHHPNEITAAMAAPQMGVLQRIIIIRDDLGDPKNKSFTALINPEIIRQEGDIKTDYEGCLSVPNSIYGLIPRHTKVKVKALLEDGTEVRIKAEDSLARTLLHEIDHLDGILFIDYIRGQKDAFYRLNPHNDIEPIADYQTEIADNKDLWSDA